MLDACDKPVFTACIFALLLLRRFLNPLSVLPSLALSQCKELKYIGMLGSKITAKHILNEMINLGFTTEQINSVNTPIGIPISSQTLAEIIQMVLN